MNYFLALRRVGNIRDCSHPLGRSAPPFLGRVAREHREMKKARREKQSTGGFPEPQFFFPPEPIQTHRHSPEPPKPTPLPPQSARNGEETLPSELWFQIFGNLLSLKDLMHLELTCRFFRDVISQFGSHFRFQVVGKRHKRHAGALEPGGILHLHVGGHGVGVSDPYWKIICQEQGVDFESKKLVCKTDDQAFHLPVMFREVSEGRYVPRALLIESNHQLEYSSSLFDPNCIFTGGRYDYGYRTYCAGYYDAGAEQAQTVLEHVRRQLEMEDKSQGFMLMSSLAGGTGSGLGAKLAVGLRENYPEQPFFSYAFLPPPPPTTADGKPAFVTDPIFHTYNTILSLLPLSELSDQFIFLIRKDRMTHLASKVFGTPEPSLPQLHHLTAQVYSSLTLPFRCKVDGEETNMRKFVTNFKFFPQLSFLSVSHLPFINEFKNSFNGSESSVVKRLLKGGTSLSHDPVDGYRSVAVTGYSLFRCNKLSSARLMKDSLSSLTEVVEIPENDNHTHSADNHTATTSNNNKIPPRLRVLSCIPDSVRHGFSPVLPPPLLPEDNILTHNNDNVICSATLTRNSDAFIPYMQAMLNTFDDCRKKHIFWRDYESMGFDWDFQEASFNIQDIVSGYQSII